MSGAAATPLPRTDPVVRYAAQARAAGQRWGIPTSVLLGLVTVESGGNINAVSSAGAFGLTQFIPATAATYGVRPGDAASQLEGAAKYLHDLGFASRPAYALNAYNGAQTIGGAPNPYAAKVLTAAARYGDPSNMPAAPPSATGAPQPAGDVLAPHVGTIQKGITWAGLLLAGVALLGLGVARASGLRKPHGLVA